MVRVGMAGAGFMGNTHAQCYQLMPGARLVAVADPTDKARDAFCREFACAGYPTLEDMLSDADLDAIDICTPTFLHAKQAIAAARAGKHVVCEKPMALTVGECTRMINAARRAGTALMVAQVLRFWPEYVLIADLVRSRRLGRVRWARASRLGPSPKWSWDDWIRDAERSGGPILDLHIHDLDYLSWLLGKPTRVYAQAVAARGRGFVTVLTTLGGHRHEAKSAAAASMGMAGDFPFTMDLLISAQKGTIAYSSTSSPTLTVMPDGAKPYAPRVPQPHVPKSAYGRGNIQALGGYYVELKYFVDCVRRGERPKVVTPQEGRFAVKLCRAAEKSAQTGQVVKISP